MKAREYLLGMQTQLFEEMIEDHGKKVGAIGPYDEVTVREINVDGRVSEVLLEVEKIDV